ncbi:MAG: phage integrase N-terminal SAM-like domain-containing protein [Lewinellaceae bacterium]|nr:phage integrase N-terminal SAM-like domain-containing protein [Lewinellaceae bacterium]
MANHLAVAGLDKSTALNYVRSLCDVQERTGKPADTLTRDELLAYLAARRKHLSASTLTVVCALKYYYREVARRLELVVDIPNLSNSAICSMPMNCASFLAQRAACATAWYSNCSSAWACGPLR